jgi:hypothetical protein
MWWSCPVSPATTFIPKTIGSLPRFCRCRITRREIELKLRRYREALDNLYAVVIDPREFLVEIYARNRNWQAMIRTRADDPIEMPEFGLAFRVGALYRGTPLDPQSRGIMQ